MSDNENEEDFKVEKIIRKRLRAGRVEYFLKWEGYSEEDNTWEPASNLSCPELIAEFESAQAAKIKAAADRSSGSSSNAGGKSGSKSGGGDTGSGSSSVKKAKKDEKVGFDRGLDPDKIIGATDTSGELMFLVKWKGTEDADLVPSALANERIPQTVITFYEERLTWHQKDSQCSNP